MTETGAGATPGFPWQRPLGAFPNGDGEATFRVWAPLAEGLALSLDGRELALEDQGFGIFELRTAASPGQDYEYVVDGRRLPDPASRWQAAGLRGPSRLLDTTAFDWTDGGFAPAPMREQVIYELHVGTFTPEGTFDAAIEHLAALAQLGITSIELMPVAEFPGARGWGYDGVYLSAPQSSYGGPLGLQRLVDAAHGAGLGVILDVVYNHLGASGDQAMEAFGPYFTQRYTTFWGQAINYDDSHSDPVRELVCQSAVQWVRDFHIDGLRLDAIHAIYDSRPEHIVGELTRRVHDEPRRALVIAESGSNDPKVVREAASGGFGCDASWADDFHHALRALLTGERDGWYADFGSLAQLAKAYRCPYVFDGVSPYRDRIVGANADDVPVERFVVFAQNHDQIGNRAFGDRLPAEARPLAAFCTLLSPFVPMLFMGEEYGEPAPFQFFSDHIDPELAEATREGRRAEFASFAQFTEQIPDPQDPATFERSRLTRDRDPALAGLYAQLLRERTRLLGAPVEDVTMNEAESWLLLRRGDAEMVCNFGPRPARVTVQGTEVVITTHPTRLSEGAIEIEPLAGALIR